MTIDAVIVTLNSINDRAELVAFLAPLKVPHGESDLDRARLTTAVISAASRCWKRRASARGGIRAAR